MARKNIAVLDFGSSHISVMMGSLSLNGALNLKGYGEVSYAGFMDGEFLEYEHFRTASPLLPSIVLTIPPDADVTMPV